MQNQKGQLSLQVLIFGVVSIIVISGFALWASSFLKFSLRDFNKTLAFSISEAGIEYYRWHLAHAPQDFKDGTGGPGPYVHNYYDKNGILLGQFSLEITPPPVGSTIVKIKSTGQLTADSSIQKIIQVSMGIPSFAKYAWALNDFVNFGSAAEVFGPIHSNAGIRFDGLAHNLVTSAQTSFNDPDHPGGNEFGVHTHRSPVDPLPPNPVPNRPDVFIAGRQFPVPAVDFVGITQDLAQIKADAQAAGFYRASSTALGYDVLLKTNDTFDLFRVTALVPPPGSCSGTQTGWGTWSIQTETLIGNFPLPSNGLIFLEDNVWVRGQIDSARVTITSGRFPDNPATRSSITVNNDIRYTNFDGQDVISLIAQNNINVGLMSEDDLRVDAAMIAQNGRIGRYSYSSFCGATRSRTLFTSYGMMGTNLRAVFFYGGSNGYLSRNYIYDANLLYSPPPSFPLSADQYVQISWDEVK